MTTFHPKRTRPGLVLGCLVVLGLAALAVQPSAGASLSISSPQLLIGKVDPGHQQTFEREVANTGDDTVNVEIQLVCPCETHFTVSPTSFPLEPGASEMVTMTLEVPADAEPGVHDVRVKVIERVAATTGGTGQSAIDIVASYQVRTVGLYADPAEDALEVSARIVNAYADGVDVEVTGTLATDPPREIEPVTLHAAGSEEGSRVSRFLVAVPLEDDDPDGVYTLHLQASWHNGSAGIAPGSRNLEVPIGWGVPSPGTEDPAALPDLGEGSGDGTTTGPSGQGDDQEDGAPGDSFGISGTWLVVGAALIGGVVAGVWLGRRKA